MVASQIFANLRPTIPRQEASDESLELAIEVVGPLFDECSLEQRIFRVARALEKAAPEQTVFPLSPGDHLTSRELARAVQPSVRQVRKRLFGRESIPFATYSKAVRWLERNARRQPPQSPDRQAKWHKLRPRAQRLLDELRRATGVRWSLKAHVDCVTYVRPGEKWVRRHPSAPDSPLAVLADSAKKIAQATGSSEAQVVAHILAGSRLVVPSVTRETKMIAKTLPGGEGIQRTEVLLRIRSPEVDSAQWRTIQRLVRRAWGAGRKKATTEPDLVVWRIVERLGGVPQTHSQRFWERVRNECEKRGLVYTSWRGAWMRYHRLQRKRRAGGKSIDLAPKPDASV